MKETKMSNEFDSLEEIEITIFVLDREVNPESVFAQFSKDESDEIEKLSK